MSRGVARILSGVALAALVVLSVSPVPAPKPARADTLPMVTDVDLTAQITQLLAGYKGTYRVSVRELGGAGRSVSIRGTSRVEPASTIKLFYAWLALRQVDAGRLSLTTKLASGYSVSSCLRLMISLSDNPCSTDIRERLGNRWINAQLAQQGFPGTYIVVNSSGGYVTKRVTTRDLVELYSRIEAETGLSAGSTALLHRLLQGQIWRFRLTSGLESGVMAETKSGQLLLTDGMVEADTGIVYGPTTTYAVAIIGTGGASKYAVRRISQIIYEHFEAPVITPARFPVAQFHAASQTALRTAPGGSVVASLPVGTHVEVVATERNWYQVKAAGRTGWVWYSTLALVPEYRW